MKKYKVGVVGATGYAGEEVIKILLGHKSVNITELSAVMDKAEPFSSIFPAMDKLLPVLRAARMARCCPL